MKLITYGAAISQFLTPDQLGRPTDVVLGFDDMAGWQSKGNPYFGCIVGRVANRVANGKFSLNGREYRLAVNNGPNSLHGGTKGFDKVVWKGEEVHADAPSVRFTYRSPDGEEGYPGNLVTKVTYSLTASGALTIEYEATTDQSTPVNLTNHAYFNLNGTKTGSTILNHLLTIAAKKYTPTDANLIPTGQLAPVLDTPLDFTTSTEIGGTNQADQGDASRLRSQLCPRLRRTPTGPRRSSKFAANGHHSGSADDRARVAILHWELLNGTVKGKGGVVYPQYGAFCLEAQHFPDAVNHSEFSSVILQPGKTYRQTTVYRVRRSNWCVTMPELPEVETVVREVRPCLVGRRILGITASRHSLRRPWLTKWSRAVHGQIVHAVRRRGKWIIIDLDRGHLVVHLGMTGQLTCGPRDRPRKTHTHWIANLDDESQLRFRDIRRFGSVDYHSDVGAVNAFLAERLGPEPFDMTAPQLRAALLATERSLKAVLLDQTIIAGIGNIYADESLFASRLSPRQRGCDTSPVEVRRLLRGIVGVLQSAIDRRGSTIRNYVGGSGLQGAYQHEFRVYGRGGERCFRCRTLIEVVRLAGRSTHFCPTCQRPSTRSAKRSLK